MNRPKSAARPSRTPISTFVVLVVSTVVIAFGGVRHAMLKNRQIQTTREIDAIERRIEQYKLDIRTTEMRNDNLRNRYAICEKLKEAGSRLRPIPIGLAEEINLATRPTAVASTLP